MKVLKVIKDFAIEVLAYFIILSALSFGVVLLCISPVGVVLLLGSIGMVLIQRFDAYLQRRRSGE